MAVHRFSRFFPFVFARPGLGRLFSLVLPALVVMAALTLPAASARADLERFVGELPELEQEGGFLRLRLRLSVDDEDALRVILRDGASLALEIKVDVERKRSLWVNESIASLEFQSLLKYDSLTRQYRMTHPASNTIVEDGNMRVLLAKSWKNMAMPLLVASTFAPDETYLFVIKLNLQHAELPPWLDRTLVFWSREVVAPETFTVEYRLDNAAIPR